jgi:hypothetical protein
MNSSVRGKCSLAADLTTSAFSCVIAIEFKLLLLLWPCCKIRSEVVVFFVCFVGTSSFVGPSHSAYLAYAIIGRNNSYIP